MPKRSLDHGAHDDTESEHYAWKHSRLPPKAEWVENLYATLHSLAADLARDLAREELQYEIEVCTSNKYSLYSHESDNTQLTNCRREGGRAEVYIWLAFPNSPCITTVLQSTHVQHMLAVFSKLGLELADITGKVIKLFSVA